jgi:hypothetical protein
MRKGNSSTAISRKKNDDNHIIIHPEARQYNSFVDSIGAWGTLVSMYIRRRYPHSGEFIASFLVR